MAVPVFHIYHTVQKNQFVMPTCDYSLMSEDQFYSNQQTINDFLGCTEIYNVKSVPKYCIYKLYAVFLIN